MLKQYLFILRFGLIFRIMEKYIRANYLLGDRQILKPRLTPRVHPNRSRPKEKRRI